ncbi:MAG: hypothetical protein ACJ78Q_11110 [Chloroflexia bacterium]
MIIWLLLLLANISIFGYLVACFFLKQEDRLIVTLPFGLLVSTCLYGYALVIFRYIFDWPGAVLASNLLLLAISLTLLWLQWTDLLMLRPRLGVSASTACVLALLLVTVGLVTWMEWINDVLPNASETTAEVRFWHGGFSSSIARGNFPLHDTMEPEYQLFYRWTYHSNTAALSRISGLDTPFTMGLLNVWSMLLVFAGFMALLYRQQYKGRQALVGAMVFVFAGTASWISFLGTGVDLHYMGKRNELNGATVFDMLQVNPPVIFGYVAFLATLWFWLEWQKAGSPRIWFPVLCFLLAYLNATNETLVVAFGVGLVLYWLLNSLINRTLYIKELATTALLGAIGLVLSMPFSDMITSTLTRPDDTGSLRLALNVDHFGWMSTPALAGSFWVPIFDLSFLLRTGFVPLLLVILAFGFWQKRRLLQSDSVLRLLLLMGLFAFGFAMTVYPAAHPSDIYHFTQVGYVFLTVGCVLGFLRLGELLSLRTRRLMFGLLAVVAVLWVAPTGYAMSKYTVSTARWCESPPDMRAATYFQSLPWSQASRALVLNGATRSFFPGPDGKDEELYNCTPGALMSEAVMQYGGMAIPLGHDQYGHTELYAPLYARANANLDLNAINKLKIDHIYTNPRNQTDTQRQALASLEQSGAIQEVYNQNDRTIYRILTPGAASTSPGVAR